MKTEQLHIDKILVADDHELIIAGFCSLLEKSFSIGEMVTFTKAEDVISEVSDNHYDVYILDLEFQETTGFDLIKQIRNKHSDAKIIINTMHDEIWNINQLLTLEVNSIILKNTQECNVVKAIQLVMNGESYFCPQIENVLHKVSSYKKTMKSKNSLPTQSELAVLKYIVKGYTSKVIAEKLSLSEDTIEAHRKSLFLKLEARNVAHLVAIAIRHQLVE